MPGGATHTRQAVWALDAELAQMEGRFPGQRAGGAPLLVWPSAEDRVRLADSDPMAARDLLCAALGLHTGSTGT